MHTTRFVAAKFLLGVMVLNMVQIIQAAFANLLHTSCTIRIPLPGALNKFLKYVTGATADTGAKMV